MSVPAQVPEIIEPVSAELLDSFREHYGKFKSLGRRTVEAAWYAGTALAEIKASPSLPHGSWLPWLESEGVATNTAACLMKLATYEIYQLGKFGSVDAALKALSGPHVSHNSGENEWYTPSPIIEAARTCMGAIDIDPASSAKAQETVQATHFLTIENDGLDVVWEGRIWLNPPYEKGLIDRFVSYLLEQPFDQACVLVNNATETAWAQRLLDEAEAVCFPAGRIRYLAPDGVKNSPLQGQMIVGLKVDLERFSEAFAPIGVIL